MAAPMTPFDYAQLYWVLPFPIVNENNEVTGWDFARVDRYRLANRISQPGETEKYDADTTAFLNEYSNGVKPFANKDTKEIKVFTKNADGTIKTQTFARADENRLMGLAKKAIWGKGTPEQCQITLQLALRFGLAADVAALRKYCEDGKIGLDCNGFVGTYMHDALGKNVDHNTPIDSLVQAGKAINSFDEINNLNIYVLGYVTSAGVVIAQKAEGKWAHVMITQPSPFADTIGVRNGKVYQRVTVLESTGGKGLVESDYLLLEEEKNNKGKNTGVFRIFRGSKNEEMRVRIARVWV